MEGISLQTRIENQKVALRGVRVRSAIAALAERAVVEQTFVNLESVAIEAIYTFPLPEDAAVCAFEVVTGDRVLTGVVDENERNIEKYDAAIDRGDAAYLLEQERPDVFTIRVGNIKPKQAATIRLTFVRPLKVVDRQIRLPYPTTVSPRYATATGSSDPLEAQIDGDAVNPPHVLHVPYGMSMEIDLDLGRGVLDVTSPSHSIRVEKDAENDRRKITFGGGLAEMDRDVVIDVRLAKEQKPGVVVTKGSPANGTAKVHFLAVTFMPEFADRDLADAPSPSETVFVIDCSGSMQGESTRQAQAALELCLRSLAPGDTFNICRFGSTFELMRSEPLNYDGHTLRDALNYVRRGADLGGTELFPPLKAIFATSPEVGVARNIVLLTDGQVSNEPEVISLARANRLRNRIFSFGIGAAASAHLVTGLARATGGAAEFITANERIDEKVLRTFGRMASPMVSDVEIDWGGADVQTLAEIPPIFDGDAVAVYARTLGSPPKEVTLRCNFPSGETAQWSVPVGYSIPDDAGIVSTMWARRAIQSFEEVNGVRRTSARLREQNRDRERLIALSKQFNLVCSLTSFIAVEHRSVDERNEGAPEVRRVPVKLAAGWDGHFLHDPLVAMRSCVALHCAEPAQSVPTPRKRMVARCVRRPAISQDSDYASSPAGGGAGAGDDDVELGAELMEQREISLDRSISLDRTIDMTMDWSEPTERPLIKLVQSILADAIRSGATRVDLQPASDSMRAVFTVAGAAHERDRIPLRMAKPLIALLKRLTADDSLTTEIDGLRVRLPVTFTPSPAGEAIAINLPPREAGVVAAIKRKLHVPKVVLCEATRDGMLLILKSQTAEGRFEHWPSGLPPAVTLEVAPGLDQFVPGQFERSGKVTFTVVCLLALQTLYAERRDTWQRAHAKAVRYAATTLGIPPAEITSLVDRLATKLGSAESAQSTA